MNARTPVAVLLVLLLVSSGCLTPTPQNPDGDGDGNQTTYPPGVTAEGIQNATALFGAHTAVLRNTSYAMNATESFRINGIPREITVIQRFSAQPNGTVFVNKTQADDGTTVLVLNRWGPDDDGLYYLREFRPQSVNVTYAASQDRSYLGLRNYTREVETLVSEAVIDNQSVTEDMGGWRIDIETQGGSSITLSVNESGFIRQAHLGDEAAQDHTFTLTYTKTEGVDRPAWIDRARDSIGFWDGENQNETTGNSSS